MKKKFSFGSLFDSVSKLVNEKEAEKKMSPQQKSHRQEIENSILVLAAEVIRCDKNFSDDTENFLLQFFTKQFGGQAKNHRITSLKSHLETSAEPFTKIACKELKLLATYDSRLSIVHFLFGLAAADDFVNAKETRSIHRMAQYLGISENDFKEIKQNFLSNNSPYFTLGVEDDSSFEIVKVAYRKAVLKFHPDKRNNAVSEEEANLKFREIQRAFERIKELHKNE